MLMRFKGELTKHILKCYPAGKANDKKPVPNELSMLIFYLQTRPAKIPKAAKLLQHRAEMFSSKENIGNLGVTALIMHQFIRDLHVHFSLFAECALEVINVVIDKSFHDSYFLSLAQELYTDFNRYHNGVLFAGKSLFGQRFLDVTNKLVKISQTGTSTFRISAIVAMTSLSKSPALATKVAQNALLSIVKGLEENFSHDPKTYVEATEIDIGRYSADKSGEVGLSAAIGLRQVLDTPSLEQISVVVQNLLQWLSTGSGDWRLHLVAYLARWIPPQNRFMVTKLVVSAMSSLPIDNIKLMATYSSYLDVLLSADESKIGLSVVDVLRQLLRLQHRLIDSPPPSIDFQRIQVILGKLRQNIGNLVNTNIYPGQTGDMVVEILQRYQMSHATNSGNSDEGYKYFHPTFSSISPSKSVGTLHNDFRVLLEILQSDAVHDQRKLNLSLWAGTQWILTYSHPQVLLTYSSAFSKFLEFAQLTSHPSTKKGSIVFRQLCELGRQDLPSVNYVAIYYCMLSLIQFQGQNSQFLIPWIEAILPQKILSNEANLNHVVCRSSVSLASLLAVFRILGIDEPANTLFGIITEKVNHKLWLPGITYPPVITLDVAVSSLSSGERLQFMDAKIDYLENSRENLSIFIDRDSISDTLNLEHCTQISHEDLNFILAPPFSLDSSTEAEDIRNPMTLRSLSDLHNCNSRTFSSTSKTPSSIADSQAPRIDDLRKRQTDVQSLRTIKSTINQSRQRGIILPPKNYSSNSQKPSDEDFLTIIDKIDVNGDSHVRGNLTT